MKSTSKKTYPIVCLALLLFTINPAGSLMAQSKVWTLNKCINYALGIMPEIKNCRFLFG